MTNLPSKIETIKQAAAWIGIAFIVSMMIVIADMVAGVVS